MTQLPTNIDQLERTKFVMTSVGKPGVIAVNPDGTPISSSGGITSSLVTLLAGPNQIGSVTISNPIQIAAGTNYIGLATVVVSGLPTVFTQSLPYSFYQQTSLVSGYAWYGLTTPGSNPTTATFKIQRETLSTGEILFANGAATYINVWSAASLASISYL
jgi:hypothetical protein